jgi:hypothetical protein
MDYAKSFVNGGLLNLNLLDIQDESPDTQVEIFRVEFNNLLR